MSVGVLWLALSFMAGCSNKLEGTDTDDTQTGDTDTEVVDTDTDIVDTEPQEDDFDGDGFMESDGDCDDDNDAVYPDAPELCDGIDNDCDGHDDSEFDDDGDNVANCEDNCPIWVDVAASNGLENGTVTDPFVWIQDAIDAADRLNCAQIRVFPGTYEENIDFLEQDVEIESTNGAEDTIIQGDGTASVVSIDGGQTDQALLQGFTITNGGGAAGAGLYIAGASPVIAANIIIDNDADQGSKQGGGIFLINSDAYVIGNTIEGNNAGIGGVEDGCDGGGLFVRSGAPVIEANDIFGNTAGDGGGLWFARADALLISNNIIGNTARDTNALTGGQGGGVDIQIGTSDFLMAGNLVVDNVASTHGGGVAVYEYSADEGSPTVMNNTIAFNKVELTEYGAGLVGFSTTAGKIKNNLIYFNDGVGVWLNAGSVFTYNDVFGNTTNYAGTQGTLTGTTGNVSVDPKVVGVTNNQEWRDDNWDLQSTSPLKNGGDPAVTNADGTRSDIGATGGAYGL